MNEFQTQLFEYFTQPGHPERTKALAEMVNHGYFGAYDEALLRGCFARLLETWEDEGTFCRGGIERARKALLPSSRITETLRVEVEIQVERPRVIKGGSGKYNPRPDGQTGEAIQKALTDHTFINRWGGQYTFTGVTVKSIKKT